MALPDPDFAGMIAFANEKQIAVDYMAGHDRKDLIMYWDEGNKWWRVTTTSNFQCDEYWDGQPPSADDLETILKET